MNFAVQPKTLAIILIALVFAHTVQLVRTDKLSAHLAISWIITEIILLLLCLVEWPFLTMQPLLGEGKAFVVAALLGVAWMALLMLDSLTRISALTHKLKDINQELALLRQALEQLVTQRKDSA